MVGQLPRGAVNGVGRDGISLEVGFRWDSGRFWKVLEPVSWLGGRKEREESCMYKCSIAACNKLLGILCTRCIIHCNSPP